MGQDEMGREGQTGRDEARRVLTLAGRESVTVTAYHSSKSQSRKPLANGLLAIFSCVICWEVPKAVRQGN